MAKDLVVQCAVRGCKNPVYAEVILYDVYPTEKRVFFQQDYTCPFLCAEHIAENEAGARGARCPRGSVRYPFSNKGYAQGFTIYRPLGSKDRN